MNKLTPTYEHYTGDGEIPEDRQQLQQDLAQIRGELDRTLDELGDRLQPEELQREAKEKLEEMKDRAVDKVGDLKERAIETAGEKPLLVGIAAVGVLTFAWLYHRRGLLPLGIGAVLGAAGTLYALDRLDDDSTTRDPPTFRRSPTTLTPT